MSIRAGALTHYGELYSGNSREDKALIKNIWVGLRRSDADLSARQITGILENTSTLFYTRYDPDIDRDQYLFIGNRIWRIQDIENLYGKSREIYLHCKEYIGVIGSYVPYAQSAKNILCKLVNIGGFRAESFEQVYENILAVEFPEIEFDYSWPIRGDTFILSGTAYDLIGPAEGKGTGVVRVVIREQI